ncbi:unnamed protein product, partial [Heterotrigona itama]
LIRGNKANDDDNSFIIKERKNSSAKQRFLRNNICNFSKFRMKNDSQKIKQYEKRCKLKTLLQEKKKLLAPCENKLETSTNNIDLTKQLSLKMSFSSLHIKDVPKSISNKWDIKDPENFETSELSTQNINSIYRNSYQNDKSICFSDTDLKFLIIPLSSKKSDSLNDDILLCKWDSENINNSRRQNNVSSKLIELKFEDTDSLNDNKQKYKISTVKSTNSLLAKNLATDSKYFSDSAANKLDTLSNAFLNKLKRSTNSCINSTLSDVSNTIKITNNQILSINSKTNNISTCITDKTNGAKKDKLKELKSEINLTDAHFKKIQEKMKSSIDILRCNIKEAQNYRKISNSNENCIHTLLVKTDTFRNYIAEPTASEKLVSNNNNSFILSDNKSEICEIYDELGILFSQYLKLQTRPCQRKYCSLKRYLKQKIQHTTKKCQTRFNYQHVYPYDQRPACNSGNVCIDTYDELKLMYKSSTERKNIYQRMFKRRKHFLNQPCILSNQNFAIT